MFGFCPTVTAWVIKIQVEQSLVGNVFIELSHAAADTGLVSTKIYFVTRFREV